METQKFKKSEQNYDSLLRAYLKLLRYGCISCAGSITNSWIKDKNAICCSGISELHEEWQDESMPEDLKESRIKCMNTIGDDMLYQIPEDMTTAVPDMTLETLTFNDPVLKKAVSVKHKCTPNINGASNDFIEYYYCSIDKFTNRNDRNAICLFHHVKNLSESDGKEASSLLNTDSWDDLAKMNLSRFADELANDYIARGLRTLSVSFENPTMYIDIPDLLTAVFMTIITFDYKKNFVTCAKPNCNKLFLRNKDDKKSMYCCPAHSRSEAQAKHRARVKENRIS